MRTSPNRSRDRKGAVPFGRAPLPYGRGSDTVLQFAGGAAEGAFEGGDVGAHAGISGVECCLGNRLAFCQCAHRMEEAGLLPPHPEAHTGVGAKEAFERTASGAVLAAEIVEQRIG